MNENDEPKRTSTPSPLEDRLLSLADLICGCDTELREHWRDERAGFQCLRDEQEAWETIQEHAPDIARALSILAMRFNRAALGNHEMAQFTKL